MERLSKRIRCKPTYPERILQIGEGNFMRGFIDWQIHRLNEETDFNGSAVVVPPRRGSVQALNEQDGLYTLYLEGRQEGREIRESVVITSISRGSAAMSIMMNLWLLPIFRICGSSFQIRLRQASFFCKRTGFMTVRRRVFQEN